MRFLISHRGRCLSIGFLIVLILCPTLAQADGAAVQTIIKQKGVWDSNPLMLANDAETIYGSTTSPELAYTNQTPTTKIKVSASVDENIFNRSSYNSTDFHGTTAITQKNERWEAALQNKLDYDTTRTSEFTNNVRNVGAVRHFTYSVSPTLAFTPTVLDHLALTSSFEKDVYDSAAYTNYTLVSLTPSYTRGLTPLTSALVSLQAQRYQSERDPKRRVDSLSPSFGFLTKLTPEWKWNANGGMQVAQEQGQTVTDTDWNWNYVFSNELTYEGEKNDVSFKASRARSPSSDGTESLLSDFSIDTKHDLNTHWSLTFGTSYRYANYSQETSNQMDTMVTGRTSVVYHLTQELDLTTSYQYREKQFTNDYGTARQNLGHIGLFYRCNWVDMLP